MRRQFSLSQWVINHKLAENPGIGWPSHVHSYYYWGKWLPFAKPLTSDSKVRQNSNPAHVLHRSYVLSLDQCVLTSILLLYCILDRFETPILQVGTILFQTKVHFWRKINANIFTFRPFFVANRDTWLKRPSSEQQFDPWLHAFIHVIEIMRDDCFELLVISSWSFCLILASAVSVLVGALGKIHWGYYLHYLRL